MRDFILKTFTDDEAETCLRCNMQELVLCKDCKYWLPMNRFHQDYHPGKGDCDLNGWVSDSDWFCADGERKSTDEILMEEMDADPLG